MWDLWVIVMQTLKPPEVLKHCAGAQVVFHSATAAPAAANTANRKLMHDVNVTGTEHVIAACLAARVPALVYTSSASVVFDGTDLIDTDESAPYAARPIDFYTETKVAFYHAPSRPQVHVGRGICIALEVAATGSMRGGG